MDHEIRPAIGQGARDAGGRRQVVVGAPRNEDLVCPGCAQPASTRTKRFLSR